MSTKNNKKASLETVNLVAETVNLVAETIETVLTPIERLQSEIESMTISDAVELFNRLPLSTLEKLQGLYSDKAKASLNQVEKAVLTARNEPITDLSVKAIDAMLKEEGTTSELLISLPKSLFNQLFTVALAAVQPATVKPGKAEKRNDLSHQFMLSICRFSYQKEANVDSFNFKAVQPLEALTLADFVKHCEKNTFANNTTFPVIIDGETFADKKSAVEKMASKMFAWYSSAMTASVKQD